MGRIRLTLFGMVELVLVFFYGDGPFLGLLVNWLLFVHLLLISELV